MFWGSLRNEDGKLIAFGYITGPGIEHGYLEDVIIHSHYQGKEIGKELVKILMQEAEKQGISIITVIFQDKHNEFYEKCGLPLARVVFGEGNRKECLAAYSRKR
ncbi:GNAT family N-acetyltransferase [Paenibacillus sp. IHBB 10380]|uniref:GNAT family N-acetyltransferase n=1 Tax=Paenibacillus sp. IHBB 10380 TaxID=1566358 RepID=UPI000B1A971B|nr:GNAT family N-acetyltransferase [Paenibacillus sp. IHBB 10380]